MVAKSSVPKGWGEVDTYCPDSPSVGPGGLPRQHRSTVARLTPRPHSPEYLEGRECCEQGGRLRDCPYLYQTSASDLWQLGYVESPSFNAATC